MSHFALSAAGLLTIYCALVLLASLAGGWLLLALRLTHARLQYIRQLTHLCTNKICNTLQC
jgi:hypothetical protein